MSKLLAVAILSLSFALPALAAEAPEPNSTLEQLKGQVSVNEGKEFAPATLEMRLKPGDRVMVEADSSATIVFDDKCRLDIKANKLVTVPDQSVCAGALLVEQGLNPAGGAAIGGGVSNTGMAVVVGVVLVADAVAISEGDDDTVSP